MRYLNNGLKAHHSILMAITLLLMSAAPVQAVVIFSDDFNDGDADGWSYYLTDAAEWGVVDNRLNSSTGADDSHDGVPGFALMDGIEIRITLFSMLTCR